MFTGVMKLEQHQNDDVPVVLFQTWTPDLFGSNFLYLKSCTFRVFPGKNTWGGEGGIVVGTPSILWGTTTRILIIFGVPPHRYKYLK